MSGAAPDPPTTGPESRPERGGRSLQAVLIALGAAVPATMIFLAVLGIVLGAAPALRLSPAELAGWIATLYALPGALGVALAIRYRQPLILTGNVFVIIVVASLAGDVPYSDLVGAAMLAGLIVVLFGALGLTSRLARWIPPPIMLGLLAGAILPFVVRTFGALGDLPLVVGAVVVGYLLAMRFLGARIPAVLPALVVGVGVAALTGELRAAPALTMPIPAITLPTFSAQAIFTVTPVFVALMTLQANVPSAVFLRSQAYAPPERTIDVVSGAGTVAASLLGPTAFSIPLPVIPLVAGPDAGEHDRRYLAACAAGGALVAIGLLAGVAVVLSEVIPPQLLVAVAGLALFGVLSSALKQVASGSLLLGPLFAFAIAQSPLSLLGFGPYFWALLGGIGVSMLLEREELDRLQDRADRAVTEPVGS